MAQCDNWVENDDNFVEDNVKQYRIDTSSADYRMVAEEEIPYRRKGEY